MIQSVRTLCSQDNGHTTDTKRPKRTSPLLADRTMAKRRSRFRLPKVEQMNNQPSPSFVAYFNASVYAVSGWLMHLVPRNLTQQEKIIHNTTQQCCIGNWRRFWLPRHQSHDNQTLSSSLLHFYWSIYAFSIQKIRFPACCCVLAARSSSNTTKTDAHETRRTRG